MFRRFSHVNTSVKKMVHAAYGTAGSKFPAAFEHQITQISGLIT